MDLSGQLSTRGVDFVTAGLARGRDDPGCAEKLAEAFDHPARGAHKARVRKRVERNQVDLAWHPRNQFRELACVLLAIVDTFEHDVFEGDEVARRVLEVPPTRG